MGALAPFAPHPRLNRQGLTGFVRPEGGLGGTAVRSGGKDSDTEMEAIANYWKELERRVRAEDTGLLSLSVSELGL